MKKKDRISALFPPPGGAGEGTDPRLLGYFACFNRGEYYEAHDVLEHLWLETSGPDREFLQGLIQLAGAFVHLRKQQEEPEHPKHGRRLGPAARLLRSAEGKLESYGPRRLGVDVAAVCALCREQLAALESGLLNPWNPACRPSLPWPAA